MYRFKQQIAQLERRTGASQGKLLHLFNRLDRRVKLDSVTCIAALENGHLRAAGLDVFAAEPLPDDSRLTRLDNVVMMPHVAWLTPETLDRSLAVAVDNMPSHFVPEKFGDQE